MIHCSQVLPEDGAFKEGTHLSVLTLDPHKISETAQSLWGECGEAGGSHSEYVLLVSSAADKRGEEGEVGEVGGWESERKGGGWK